MYISTFHEEQLIDEHNMIIKALMILTFIYPREDTNIRIYHHENKKDLEVIRDSEITSKYFFLSLVNPLGYNLITKHLPKPNHRGSIEEDFIMVNTDSLWEYMQIVNVLSNTIALN